MARNLWAPWRISYLEGLSEPADRDDRGCFLCEDAAVEPKSENMAGHLLLLRDERGMILLNRFPYTNGHLLVAPLAHVSDLSDLSAAQRHGLIDLADLANRLIKAALNAQGVNLGMNLGRCAGAGVPGHVHLHAVPRWHGDVNFMDVVAGVRVIPQALERSYERLKAVLPTVE